MNISELNKERNKLMDEIIEIEEKTIPLYQKQKREIIGKITLATKQKNQHWKKIKQIHKDVKKE